LEQLKKVKLMVRISRRHRRGERSAGIRKRLSSRPVHVIITLTPGSSTDIVGRIVAQKLSE
jgi:hypothetical protein